MSIGLESRRGRDRNESGLIIDVMRHVAIEIAQRQKMEECAGLRRDQNLYCLRLMMFVLSGLSRLRMMGVLGLSVSVNVFCFSRN